MTESEIESPPRWKHEVQRAISRAESLMSQGSPLRDVLAQLTCCVETLSGGTTTASILMLDREGLLRNGASPNLPADYLDRIDRLRPHPRLGTCAAAAATGRMVLTPDFQADDKWAELRHLPLSIGYRGAWSLPLTDTRGVVVGTFGTYFRDPREPTDEEIAAVTALAPVAARAIGRAAGVG